MEGTSLEGKKVHNHLIQSLIGEGGMGVVYKAVEQDSGEVKAIKFLRRIYQEEVKRFLQEASVGKRLSHPNIVQIFAVGKLKDHPLLSYFMIMEYVDGTSLKKKTDLSSLRIIEICLEICKGLAAIHRINMVHRDLKPSNILITNDGVVKISDLGVVKLTEETQFTQTGALIGTPAYMSPEQCKDSSRVDARSDIYSFGVMIFEMFANRLPFKGPTDYNFIVQHSFDAPPSLAKFAPDLPPLLYNMVARMLEKDMSRRYQSVEDVEHTLKQIASEMLGTPKVSRPKADVPAPPMMLQQKHQQKHQQTVVHQTPPTGQHRGILARFFHLPRIITQRKASLPARPRLPEKSGRMPKASARIQKASLPEGSFQDQLRSIVGKTAPVPKLSGRKKKETGKSQGQQRGEQVITETRVTLGKTGSLPKINHDQGEQVITERRVIIGDSTPFSKVSGRKKKK